MLGELVNSEGDISQAERDWLEEGGWLCWCAERLKAHRNGKPFIFNSSDREKRLRQGATIIRRNRPKEADRSRRQEIKRNSRDDWAEQADAGHMGELIRIDFRNRRRIE